MPNSTSRSVRPVRIWREARRGEELAHCPEWVVATRAELKAATKRGVNNHRKYSGYQWCLFGSPRVYL